MPPPCRIAPVVEWRRTILGFSASGPAAITTHVSNICVFGVVFFWYSLLPRPDHFRLVQQHRETIAVFGLSAGRTFCFMSAAVRAMYRLSDAVRDAGEPSQDFAVEPPRKRLNSRSVPLQIRVETRRT